MMLSPTDLSSVLSENIKGKSNCAAVYWQMSILLKNLKNDHLICHSVSYPEISAMYAPDSKKGTYLQIPQCSIKDGAGN